MSDPTAEDLPRFGHTYWRDGSKLSLQGSPGHDHVVLRAHASMAAGGASAELKLDAEDVLRLMQQLRQVDRYLLLAHISKSAPMAKSSVADPGGDSANTPR